MSRQFFWTAVLIAAFLWSNSAFAQAQSKAGNVLATIGRVSITDKDLDDFINAMPESLRGRYRSADAKKKLLDSIVEMKMFALEASRLALEKDPEVEKRIQSARERILSHEYLTKKVLTKVEVSEQESRKFYEEHKKDYSKPAQAKIMQILVGSEAEAQKIVDELKKGGDFAAIARQKSKDPSAARGGDVGWIEKSANPTPFEQAAFSLKKGQLSDPVKTEKGYYIIKSDGVRPEFNRTYEQAKEGIIARLKMDKQKDLLEKAKSELRKQLKVQVNYNLIKGDVPPEDGKGKAAVENPFERAIKQREGTGKASEELNPFIEALKKALEKKSQ